MSGISSDVFNVFVYGTLMDKARLNSLIKRIPEMHPAKVSGYRQFYDESVGYQNAERDDRSSVRGMLLSGITAQELRTLDHYEGIGEGLYRRVKVRAFTLDKKSWAEAFMYVKN
ncbi:gamma-glutamylcyclotransferase family protein [Methanocella conradii]|uniref:gamma-glutamylcyclotransferase family protein n=1 Tax=Methanocella conradii TaxID=1175444 RepID=UPI00157C1B20|nr:gamma-glutamylcyclotransferase family protein [Methanocella conradii]